LEASNAQNHYWPVISMLLGKCVRREGERFSDPCGCGGYFAKHGICRRFFAQKLETQG